MLTIEIWRGRKASYIGTRKGLIEVLQVLAHMGKNDGWLRFQGKIEAYPQTTSNPHLVIMTSEAPRHQKSDIVIINLSRRQEHYRMGELAVLFPLEPSCD